MVNWKDFRYAFSVYTPKSIFFNIGSIISSDVVVVSFQKCGKTWLRLMLSNILQEKFNIKKVKLNLQEMTWFTKAPNILISHGGSTKDNNKIKFENVFRKKKIILLCRDPRDIVVSLFHGSRTRDKVYDGANISEFMRDPACGFPKIVSFMNLWANEYKKRPQDFITVKYEDLKNDTKKELEKITTFIGVDASDDLLSRTVEYGSFQNMRKMEMEGKINDYRMKPGNKNDPNSFRTRKGKVGGYKDELSQEDQDYIDNQVKENLDLFYGYQ
jgi:hypothetical protein